MADDQASALSRLAAALSNRPVSVPALIAALAAGPIAYTASVQQQVANIGAANTDASKLAGVLSNATVPYANVTNSPAVPGRISVNDYTGDGTTTSFTLSAAPVFSAMATVGGVYQNASAYSVAGTTVTFAQSPPAGVSIEIRVQ